MISIHYCLILARLHHADIKLSTSQLNFIHTTNRRLTEILHPIKAKCSMALKRMLTMLPGKLLRGPRMIYSSVTPPVRSVKASIIWPPFKASYEPYSLYKNRFQRYKNTFLNGDVYQNFQKI